MLIKQAGQLRAFDATCPHRGAHLAYGGRICQDVIICPFHGYSIQLGLHDPRQLSVREYSLLNIAGMIFVRLSVERDNGWVQYMEKLVNDHFIINGFEMHVGTSMETVIDNAFDRNHFFAVHGVRTDDFSVLAGDHGELIVESTMYLPRRDTGGEGASFTPAAYRAFVASPGLVAVELRGGNPYTVITGATNMPNGGCVVRLSVALPKSAWNIPPRPESYEALIQYSRAGLEADRAIWENLSPLSEPQWMPEDRPSQEFVKFCKLHHDL
jgi:hypothetical protein